VGSFLLAFVMSAFGDRLGGAPSSGADSYSYSAIGHRALFEWLRRQSVDAQRRTSERSRSFGPGAPLLVLEPGAQEMALRPWEELPRLRRLAAERQAAVVLSLPKWIGVPGSDRRWIAHASPLPVTAVDRRLGEFLASFDGPPARVVRLPDSGPLDCEGADGTRYRVDVPDPQLLQDADGVEPIVSCGGWVLVGRIDADDDAPLYIVADPDLLSNHGLAVADHARLIHDLVVGRLEARSALIDETIHGLGREQGLLAQMLGFPLVLPVLHGLLAVACVVWAGAFRFGRPRQPPTEPARAGGKRALIDNSAQLLALGGHTAESLEAYFDQTLRSVAARYAMPADTDGDAMLDSLQRVSDAKGLEMRLADLRRRIRGNGRIGDERAVRTARRLHRWRMEMTDGPGRDS